MVSELRATEVSYRYDGGIRAVESVDVAVSPGDLLCVLGPNGAGKSTLLKLLAGLLEPQSGRVEVDGESIASISDRERARRIAVVPQYLFVLPEVTVGDFVQSGRYIHYGAWKVPQGFDREVVRHSLELTGVEDLEQRGLWQLSGGQRQRVIIARALAQGSRYLLVDEPTASLDPDHQLQVFDLLHRLSSSGHAVIVVTHELNLASQYASQVLLMQSGSVHARGTAVDVFTAPILEAVYGPHLHIGTLPGPNSVGQRPFIVPWMTTDSSDRG